MKMSWLEQMSRLVLVGCIITLPIEASEYCNKTIQYYDADRMACLDRCGSYNELICRVDEVCSSTVPWGARVQPPVCMNQCPMLCKNGRYCNHDQHRCLPCSSLCSAYDTSACHMFCYDFFKALPSRFADPKDCVTNQYFDNDRIVCLDQCGADNETKCQVDQFCSSRIRWSMHYDPPACVSHCNELCDRDTYCDHISRSCMPCDTLCSGANKQACRIHCYETIRKMTMATKSTPQLRAPNEEASSAMLKYVTTYHQDPGLNSDKDVGLILSIFSMVMSSMGTGCLIVVVVLYKKRNATTKEISLSKQVDTANNCLLLNGSNLTQ